MVLQQAAHSMDVQNHNLIIFNENYQKHTKFGRLYN